MMQICISRLDKMGDMILTLPAIKAIKIENPDSRIYILASHSNAKILKGIKYIDKIIEINTNSNFVVLLKKFIIFRKLKFDFYFNLSPTYLSYFFCFFSNAQIKATLIFLSRYKKSFFSKLLTRIFSKIFCKYVFTIDRYDKLRNNDEIHQTKMILKLISMCNISFEKNTPIEILLPNKKLSITHNNKRLITIHIPDKWINNFYSEKNFFDLVVKLPKQKFTYVLTTDRSTKNKFKKIFSSFKIINNKNFRIIKQLKNDITILEELNYDNWLRVIYSSAYVITPECGCTHVSAACKVPVNIIYDANNLPDAIYKEYSPWKSRHKKFVFDDLSLNNKIVDSLK